MTIHFRAYSETVKLPFLIRDGIGLSVIILVIVGVLTNATHNHTAFVFLFFWALLLNIWVSGIVQFGTSIRIDKENNTIMIRTIGRKKIQCSLADVKLGMLRSNRVEEMKNALITNAGPYFIPEGVIFNRPKKLRWLKELC